MSEQEQRPLLFESNADQTFATYFAAENEEVIAHLQASVNGKGENLLYIYGESGLGKSHLLQASCQLARQQSKNAFYLSLAQTELAAPDILDGLENFDLLCIDALQHIAGNQAWEQALFNLFNRSRDLKRILILSSQQAPAQLNIHLADLKTRLSWGLSLKLNILNDTNRVAALAFKAHQSGFEIPEKVGQFLLTHYTRELPALWKLLEHIKHETLVQKRKLSVPFMKEILSKYHGQ